MWPDTINRTLRDRIELRVPSFHGWDKKWTKDSLENERRMKREEGSSPGFIPGTVGCVADLFDPIC
jgi:hypothetical protein